MGSLLASILGIFNKLFIDNDSIRRAIRDNKMMLAFLILNGILCLVCLSFFKQNIQKDQFIYNALNAEKTAKSQYELLKNHMDQIVGLNQKTIELKDIEIKLLQKECRTSP